MSGLCHPCGASTADPPVGGVGMDRGRTKHAVPQQRGPRLEHAARCAAVARHEAVDSERRRFGPARIGYARDRYPGE